MPFHESYTRCAVGFGGCQLGFFNVGTGFLFPAPQTDLFHIIKQEDAIICGHIS